MFLSKNTRTIALASVAIILLLILFSSMAAAQRSTVTKTYAYIPNYNGNDVTVIDADSFKKVASIKVGKGPQGVAIAPDGKSVYITNHLGNTVSIIDPATKKVTKTIKVGVAPYGVAFRPDGKRAYVANGADSSVSVIDTATNKVISPPISVGLIHNQFSRQPYGVAVTPDGRRILVTESVIDSSRVANIDNYAGYIITNIGVNYNNPTGIVINSQGTKAYVATKGDVTVIDLATNKAVGSIDIKYWAGSVALTPDGNKLYVTCNGSVYVVDTATNNILKTLSIRTPIGMSCTPDGKWLFVAQYGSNTVSVIDTSVDEVKYNIPVGKRPTPLGQFVGNVQVYK